MIHNIISIFVLGLSFGWGPCLASCGPLLLSFTAGTKKNASKSLGAYFLFSFTRVCVYLILGLLVFFFGRLIFDKLSTLFKGILLIGGFFIIILGLVMSLGRDFKFGICKLLHRHTIEYDKRSLIIFGIVLGFLPCIPLITVLSYSSLVAKSWLENILYVFAFGLGTILSPLIILAIFSGFLPRVLDGKSVYERVFRVFCGLIIIFLGIQLIIKAL